VRAVVEVSNFCRENCCYCGMPRDQRNLARPALATMNRELLIAIARPPSPTVNIRPGEDPVPRVKSSAAGSHAAT